MLLKIIIQSSQRWRRWLFLIIYNGAVPNVDNSNLFYCITDGRQKLTINLSFLIKRNDVVCITPTNFTDLASSLLCLYTVKICFYSFTTERWPLKNGSTHSFAFFSPCARKLSTEISFQGSLSLQPYLTLLISSKKRVKDMAGSLTSLYFHGRLEKTRVYLSPWSRRGL